MIMMMMMSGMLGVGTVERSGARECLGVDIKMTGVMMLRGYSDGTGHLPGTDGSRLIVRALQTAVILAGYLDAALGFDGGADVATATSQALPGQCC